MNEIKILGSTYQIIDTLDYVTLADSFVKNKIGTGHGEAKLYVGNDNSRLFSFFGDYNCESFFLKSDFVKYLNDAKQEYMNPQQDYIRESDMSNNYYLLNDKLASFNNDVLEFMFYRTNVDPPRVYINSNSEYYTFMRSIALPNISYVSILKLKRDSKYYYYFKMFIDYKSDIVKYEMPEEKEQTQNILNSEFIIPRNKEILIKSRIGQGEFRKKLLEECMYCPITLINDERLLIASHIKPWVNSDYNEKVDPKNGFILTPTYDKLFDQGFITFSDNKSLIVSPWLSPMNQNRLKVYTGKIINLLPLDNQRIKYLEYHRENVFKK